MHSGRDKQRVSAAETSIGILLSTIVTAHGFLGKICLGVYPPDTEVRADLAGTFFLSAVWVLKCLTLQFTTPLLSFTYLNGLLMKRSFHYPLTRSAMMVEALAAAR
jgi:hypothetical protein